MNRHRHMMSIVTTPITDQQIQDLVAAGKPFSVALLWWGANRHMDGASAIELEHQRRMVSLRADGVIAVLCPALSEKLAGVAVMTVSPDEAKEIMDADPCVQAGMIDCEVYSTLGFPGDVVPG